MFNYGVWVGTFGDPLLPVAQLVFNMEISSRLRTTVGTSPSLVSYSKDAPNKVGYQQIYSRRLVTLRQDGASKVSSSRQSNPFRLWCDGFGPANVLLGPDENVAAVIEKFLIRTCERYDYIS